MPSVITFLDRSVRLFTFTKLVSTKIVLSKARKTGIGISIISLVRKGATLGTINFLSETEDCPAWWP